MSTSVGTRNVFASSKARKRSLSPSHSAKHLEINHVIKGGHQDVRKAHARGNLVSEPANVERATENDVRGRLSDTCKGILDALRGFLLVEYFQEIRRSQCKQ